MPNKNPRVNLTLPPEVCSVLDRIGAVTGAGRATIIREWLLETVHVWDQVASALEAAQRDQDEAWRIMGRALSQAQGEASQAELALRNRKAAMRRRKPRSPPP